MEYKRTIKVVKIQYNQKKNYAFVTLPKWIIEKVFDCKQGQKLVWDFKGEKAILSKYNKI